MQKRNWEGATKVSSTANPFESKARCSCKFQSSPHPLHIHPTPSFSVALNNKFHAFTKTQGPLRPRSPNASALPLFDLPPRRPRTRLNPRTPRRRKHLRQRIPSSIPRCSDSFLLFRVFFLRVFCLHLLLVLSLGLLQILDLDDLCHGAFVSDPKAICSQQHPVSTYIVTYNID
jgi:hypothetical protein